ncbi:hypothetical protein KIW84_034860 [Lathyrus oleraceus]|uniref:Uncharacterized protein n=1 Tax=Pisum sativum TaxID=3888 RepID=A0A9D4Y1F0_PEA|nr:hypothetical protein KIW84_034860 [Pisum sativum]
MVLLFREHQVVSFSVMGAPCCVVRIQGEGHLVEAIDPHVQTLCLDPKETNVHQRPVMLRRLGNVNDHGMTESGNHGGSSYEETDSLALFVGPKNYASDYTLYYHDTILQVDIATTLALLFGVPIPKNNIGVLISQTVDSMTDEQGLRALQLNSCQLFRLLQAQLPDLSYRKLPCDAFITNSGPTISECKSSKVKLFCCLYLSAATLRDTWRAEAVIKSNTTEGYNTTVAAYHEFLSRASEWLSHKATDRPVSLLAFGVAALVASCLILVKLLFVINKEILTQEVQDVENYTKPWKLDEVFIFLGSLILFIRKENYISKYRQLEVTKTAMDTQIKRQCGRMAVTQDIPLIHIQVTHQIPISSYSSGDAATSVQY